VYEQNAAQPHTRTLSLIHTQTHPLSHLHRCKGRVQEPNDIQPHTLNPVLSLSFSHTQPQTSSLIYTGTRTGRTTTTLTHSLSHAHTHAHKHTLPLPYIQAQTRGWCTKRAHHNLALPTPTPWRRRGFLCGALCQQPRCSTIGVRTCI